MATDQGKTSNVNGLAALGRITGRRVPEVGTTTFRPPFVPVPLEIYRGGHRRQQFHPLKRLPLERHHRAAGAALGEYGGWLRPGWYGPGDMQARVQAEARMARESVGVLDASPLGKIEVMGPDAAPFLDFIYYNTISTLAPCRIRYGLMLREDGIVFDDGVVTRLEADHFLVSCSSGHVGAVVAALEAWRQDGNDPDRVFLHDVTPAWATITATGPGARPVAEALDLGLDLSAAALPHMRFAEARFADTPARVARVSFTGDPSYEISVPVSHAAPLWDAALEAAAREGGGPMGLEALSILRAEKGYVIVGRDTDGETMPHDLGFGGPRAKKRRPFVGDRALHTEAACCPDRRRLVGLRVAAGEPPLPVGAHVIDTAAGRRASRGHVSSSYFSPALDRPIALASVRGPLAKEGTEVELYHLGKTHRATVTSPCAFDPEGERLNA
jgi:sarcosine oxidase subunit alpha